MPILLSLFLLFTPDTEPTKMILNESEIIEMDRVDSFQFPRYIKFPYPKKVTVEVILVQGARQIYRVESITNRRIKLPLYKGNAVNTMVVKIHYPRQTAIYSYRLRFDNPF